MRVLKRIFFAAVAIYVALCVALYFEQSRFIFVPEREVRFTPKDFGCDFHEVLIGGREDTLHGWWLSADPRTSSQNGSRTLIYFHGNGGSIGANAEHACRLRNIGLNVLLFDYRGYGQSDDVTPTEQSVFHDAGLAWDYLVDQRHIRPDRIVIYGHSLGGAVAIEIAKQHPDAYALIVESTFTSIRDMADMSPNFRVFPLSLLLNQKMDSRTKIASIHLPVLVIHGTADHVVPYQMSQQLYAAAPGKKQMFLVPGAGHENCAAIAGPDYQQNVRSFLASVTPAHP